MRLCANPRPVLVGLPHAILSIPFCLSFAVMASCFLARSVLVMLGDMPLRAVGFVPLSLGGSGAGDRLWHLSDLLAAAARRYPAGVPLVRPRSYRRVPG